MHLFDWPDTQIVQDWHGRDWNKSIYIFDRPDTHAEIIELAWENAYI
jgi:hypothetical protein